MPITAEQQTDAITLLVGLTGVAPAAATLETLVTLVEGGTEGATLAEFIADHPAFSGDFGLYPGFTPNAIFATNWLTDQIGDEVTEEVLAASIEQMTADLNSGMSRGAAMFAAVSALTADTVDADLADAAAALANKATVAEYYATTSTAEENLDAMAAALNGVTSDPDTVDTAQTAIDDVIAAAQPVDTLIANLDAANDAKSDFLASIDVDDDPLTATTDATLDAAAAAATDAVDDIIEVELTVAANSYRDASDAQQAAYISDTNDSHTTASGITATALAAALNDTAGTGSIAGLDSAIAAFEAAVASTDIADEADQLADVALTEALDSFNILNGTAITMNANGTTSDGTTIVLSGTTPVLGGGISEATEPGVTELLAASIAELSAAAALAAAEAVAQDALALVENLDPTAARTTELGNLDALMLFITPTTAGAPTVAEIAAEEAALNAGEAQLQADIAAVTFDTDDATTLANLTAILNAAVTANFLDEATNGDVTAILTAFGDDATDDDDFADAATLAAALAAASTAVLTNSNANVFTTAIGVYDGVGSGYTNGDTVNTALALAPLSLAADNANTAHEANLAEAAAFAAALAAEAELLAAVDSRDDLDTAIAAANTAFGDAGFAAPVTLDSAVKAATAADDLFLTGGINSQIISFADDDILFIGDDLTLNMDDTAGDNGDNAVLEVWITGTTDTTITIETSEFGSEAAVPETYTITLTGVAPADVNFADGLITLG